jgi:hypothetical protein
MKRIGVRSRWSRGWWPLFVLTFLLVSAHIAFDVLDVDGSQQRQQLFHWESALAPTWAGTEKFLRPGPVFHELHDRGQLPLPFQSFRESSHPTFHAFAQSVRSVSLRHIVNRRAYAHRDPSSTDSSPASDPA